MSVIGAPVAVIAGHQATSDEQDQVHEPPDSQSSQGEQLPHSGAGVAQAETINPETTQEEGVQQSGDEIVSGVPVKTATRGRLRQLMNICAIKINHECDVSFHFSWISYIQDLKPSSFV